MVRIARPGKCAAISACFGLTEAPIGISSAANEGLETHHIGKMPLKIYSAARAVVDCFKFRNKLGLDVPLEARRLARRRKRVQNRELLHYGRLLRVENPMSPYLQAIELAGRK